MKNSIFIIYYDFFIEMGQPRLTYFFLIPQILLKNLWYVSSFIKK